MARLFRSKSCTTGTPDSMPPLTFSPNSPSLSQDEEEEDDDDEVYFGDFNSDDYDDSDNPATTPFISPAPNTQISQPHFSLLAVVAAALRRSLVTCSLEADNVASDVDIGWPTDVRHLSHVTFDRFNGFLGLPVELQPDVPRKPPSARMQSRLYSEGGLLAEGIFRINAENSQEENMRSQLNKGLVPHGIDVHCLSGLIKAWFRELPSGVLDSLTADQVMHCNTEEECTLLVKLLPPMDAALLDWAINLMADVVQHEYHNKMNARNIAMVFAPNMTQMADPLTALIHAVQVMNFLKMLIMKTLREREESASTTLFAECSDSVENIEGSHPANTIEVVVLHKQTFNDYSSKEAASDELSRCCTWGRLECDNNEDSLSIRSKSNVGDTYECTLGRTASVMRKRRTLGLSFKDEYDNMEADGLLNWLGLRKGMQKLRQHPVFQLSKTVKKSGEGWHCKC